MVIEVKHQIPLGAVFVMGYLYAWYELWIVIRLIRELRSSSSLAILGISDHAKTNPAVIVLSPSPTPVSTAQIDTDDKSDANSPTKKKVDEDED